MIFILTSVCTSATVSLISSPTLEENTAYLNSKTENISPRVRWQKAIREVISQNKEFKKLPVPAAIPPLIVQSGSKQSEFFIRAESSPKNFSRKEKSWKEVVSEIKRQNNFRKVISSVLLPDINNSEEKYPVQSCNSEDSNESIMSRTLSPSEEDKISVDLVNLLEKYEVIKPLIINYMDDEKIKCFDILELKKKEKTYNRLSAIIPFSLSFLKIFTPVIVYAITSNLKKIIDIPILRQFVCGVVSCTVAGITWGSDFLFRRKKEKVNKEIADKLIYLEKNHQEEGEGIILSVAQEDILYDINRDLMLNYYSIRRYLTSHSSFLSYPEIQTYLSSIENLFQIFRKESSVNLFSSFLLKIPQVVLGFTSSIMASIEKVYFSMINLEELKIELSPMLANSSIIFSELYTNVFNKSNVAKNAYRVLIICQIYEDLYNLWFLILGKKEVIV